MGEIFDDTTRANILFFHGVFPQYDIEEIFTSRIMSEIADVNPMYDLISDLKEYDAIPNVFTGMESWPKRTNLECWLCRRVPPGSPRFVPTSVEKHKGVLGYGVDGNFCTFICAGAYIDSHIRDQSKWWEAHRMLKMVYREMMKTDVHQMVRVQPPTDMVQCGGNIPTVEYYRTLDLAEAAMATPV